jgi:hypothetical protein
MLITKTTSSAPAKFGGAKIEQPGIKPIFWIAATLLLASVWVPRLIRSLWVDEAGTFFMAHRGPVAAIHVTSHWVGQSVLYAVIASFFAFDGTPIRDFALRIPSVAGILLAALFLYRLAEKGVGKHAGFLAAVIFLFHPSAIILGTQARPYALALAAVAGSCLALYEWVENRERRYLFGYIIASTLIVYLHYFFAAIFLCHAVYLGYVFVFERRLRYWHHLLASFGAIGLLITPLFPLMRSLLHEAHTLTFASAPQAAELSESLLPTMVAFGLFAAAILAQFVFPTGFRKPRPLSRSFSVLLFSWWFLTPVLFFAVSVATPMRVFLPRYIASAVPGQTLLLAYAGYSLFQTLTARCWVLCAVLLSTASPLALWASRKKGAEELQPFVSIIRSQSLKDAPPVFFSSPLWESNFYDWRAGMGNGSYLYTPFAAYPMKNRLLPLPFSLNNDEVKAHVAGVIESQLAGTREVLFVSRAFAGEEGWNQWLIARMKEAGFNAEIKTPNSYYVLIFRRTAPEPGVVAHVGNAKW